MNHAARSVPKEAGKFAAGVVLAFNIGTGYKQRGIEEDVPQGEASRTAQIQISYTILLIA